MYCDDHSNQGRALRGSRRCLAPMEIFSEIYIYATVRYSRELKRMPMGKPKSISHGGAPNLLQRQEWF